MREQKGENPIKIRRPPHSTAALRSCCHPTPPEGYGDSGVYFAKPHKPIMGGGGSIERLKQKKKGKEREVQLGGEVGVRVQSSCRRGCPEIEVQTVAEVPCWG